MIFEIIPVFYGIPPNSSDSIRGITFAFSHGVFARALEKGSSDPLAIGSATTSLFLPRDQRHVNVLQNS